MKNKYYNTNLFLRIQQLSHDNLFDQAIYEYEKYLEKYPNDCCCYAYYANMLIKCGKFEEAKTVLDNVVLLPTTPEISKKDLIYARIKLLSSCQKYEECLELVKENFDLFDERNISVIEILLFLKKQLGSLTDCDYSGYSYKTDMIISYDEKRVINCIKRSEANPKNQFTFYDNFLLEETYYKLRKLLPLDKKLYHSITENSYIFRYDNCGKLNNNLVNYIEVITIQGTNDIIMIYPYENKEKFSCIDLTPQVSIEDDKHKVKRLSQIEKFNQRYSKN